MSAQCILGIDVGTTNCKAIVTDGHLNLLSCETAEYPLSVPHPGWSEQNPELWRKAVMKVAQAAIDRSKAGRFVKAIGLSGQMHGMVALDAQDRPVRPAILWNDQRCGKECEEIYERVGGKSGLLRYTNNAMLPGYTAGKILWMRRHEPRQWAQTKSVLLPKDYIRFCLTGTRATDVSDASGTGLFNVQRQQWSQPLLDKLKLPSRLFPPVFESTQMTGHLHSHLAAKWGLPQATPVFAGGGDAVMQALGSGISGPETLLLVIGTGGNVTASTDRYRLNHGGRVQYFCSGVPGHWIVMGVTLSAGAALKWFKENVYDFRADSNQAPEKDPYGALSRIAQQSTPGANGLLFAPYLAGERCPYADPGVRAAWTGLGLNTRYPDLVRSVFEGITYSLYDAFSHIQKTGQGPRRICLSGGGASSPLWRQMIADVFQTKVFTLKNSGLASAMGCAIAAGVGAGIWPSASRATVFLKTESETKPRSVSVKIYARQFQSYQKLYDRIKPVS